MSSQANNTREGTVANSRPLSDKGIQLPVFVHGTPHPGQENYILLCGYTSQRQLATVGNLRLCHLANMPVSITGKDIVTGHLLTVNPEFYDKIQGDPQFVGHHRETIQHGDWIRFC